MVNILCKKKTTSQLNLNQRTDVPNVTFDFHFHFVKCIKKYLLLLTEYRMADKLNYTGDKDYKI